MAKYHSSSYYNLYKIVGPLDPAKTSIKARKLVPLLKDFPEGTEFTALGLAHILKLPKTSKGLTSLSIILNSLRGRGLEIQHIVKSIKNTKNPCMFNIPVKVSLPDPAPVAQSRGVFEVLIVLSALCLMCLLIFLAL